MRFVLARWQWWVDGAGWFDTESEAWDAFDFVVLHGKDDYYV